MAYLLIPYFHPDRYEPVLSPGPRMKHAFWGKPEVLPTEALPDSFGAVGPAGPDGLPRPNDFMQSRSGVVVSARFREMVEGFDPGACLFIPISAHYDVDDPAPMEGKWYYAIFLKSCSPILEHRSTFYWFVAPVGLRTIPEKVQDAELYCHRKAVQGLTFWCGLQEEGTLPTNVASCFLVYVSDAFYEAAIAAGITGLDHAVRIEELADDDAHTTAPRAPCHAQEHYEQTGQNFYRIGEDHFELKDRFDEKDEPITWVDACYNQILELERDGPDDKGWVDLLPEGPLTIEASRNYHFEPMVRPQYSIGPFQLIRKALRDEIERLQPGRQAFVPIDVFYTTDDGERRLTPGESFLTRAPRGVLSNVPELAQGLRYQSGLYPFREVPWSAMEAQGTVAAIDPGDEALHFFRMNGYGSHIFISDQMLRVMKRFDADEYPWIQLTINRVRRRSS